MTFTTVKNEPASNKFFLCRLEGGRYISGLLTLKSGNTYQYDFPETYFTGALRNVTIPFVVSKLQVNGSSYTRTVNVPTSGEYSYNESTRHFEITLPTALTTQAIVFYYYIFITDDITRQASENPMNSSTTVRNWFPRLVGGARISFNQRDIIDGFLSTGLSSVSVENQDSYFNQYLGENDSFSNKEIIIWSCLNDISNIQVAFKGVIKGIRVGSKVDFDIEDELSKLSRINYSNGNVIQSTYNKTKFPNMAPSSENQPIRKLYCETSYYKVIDDTNLYKVDGELLLQAVNINYNQVPSTSNNRIWGTVLAEGDYGDQTDSVQSIDNTNPNYTVLGTTAGKKYKIGDTLDVNGQYVRVLDIGTNNVKVTKNLIIVVTDAIIRKGVSCVVITQTDIAYYALYGRDYTLSVADNIIKITFVNNFEASLGMAALNPDSDLVKFRAWANTTKSLNHGSVVKELLESAGFTVNSASITQANLTLMPVNFTLPYVGEDSFVSYRTVLQDLLNSTFGYLSVNNDLEIKYSIFGTLSPTTTIDERFIMKDTFSTDINYSDIVTSMVPVNPHDIIELNYSNAPISNDKAKYLHDLETEKTYSHLLASTSRMQKILDVLSERRVNFTLETKTINLDSIIGDEFILSTDKMIDGVTSKSVKIIGIDKTSNNARMITTDLKGI